MVRTTPAILTALLLITACQNDPRESPQYQQLAEDTRRAEALIAEKDSMLDAMFGTFNRISENLRNIRARQGQLTAPLGGAENGRSGEERIMEEIEQIDGLLAENRALIDKLRGQARSSAKGLNELERTLADFETTILEQDQEIADIKEQLASSNSSLATLIDMYRDKSQQADQQARELNTAWYAVGTAKELRDAGVLTKEGGVVGIGGVDKLTTKRFPAEHFTQVEIDGTERIPVLAKKARLVTTHPEGTYRFTDGAHQLLILDRDAFWSLSKYLVVVVE
ncbi:MAG: hypothetical protein KIT10_06555 [Flavobacteriales bacterium]|nr:hypothetical protein [Flavobacteriales bacterium]